MDGGILVNKLLKKYIGVILAVFIFMSCIPINASAGFTDIQENATYKEALDRMISLGVIAESQNFYPDALLTREQFAKMIIIAAGLENTASSMNGSTIFPDITANSWSSGYINVAVNKGYITGWYDGKFRPTEPITMAQLCTSFLKALGYTYKDITGEWPDSYIIKAAELGLTDGITINKNDGVPRWAAVLMIDRLMNTNIKGSTGITFIDSTGYYTKCTVFGDSTILDTLSEGQVLTDKGTFNNPLNIKLELGSENYIAIKNGNIVKAAALSSVLKISVDQITGSRVSYKDDDTVKSMVLPSSITYYYNGKKTDYDTVLAMLEKSVSIVFNYTPDKTGYSFAVVFDPVYSKPEIADNFTASSGRIGTFTFGKDPVVMRDGEIISITQIEPMEIVYQVSDIWGYNKYILVIDNKVGGKITDITPNKLSPKVLQIDNVNYDISKDIEINKINLSNIDLSINNNVIVYLGNDGKIINIEGFDSQNNSEFAIVLDNGYTISTDNNGLKKYDYTVRLHFSGDFTATYNVSSNASAMKGKLVKYEFIDTETISLEQIPYNFPSVTLINKEDRLLGDSYVSEDVKIFNCVYNDSGSVVTANILKWSDMPNGKLPEGKIWFTSKSGAFDDIDVIFTDDILNQRYKTGIIKSINIVPSAKGSTYLYSILIDGSEYSYTEYNSGVTIGSVYNFKMSSKGIESLSQGIYPFETGTQIQAIDSRRIKINDKIFFFDNNISVYYKDSDGSIKSKGLSAIDTARTYQKLNLYSNNSNDVYRKVIALFLVE